MKSENIELPNHIEEYFNGSDKNGENFKELFEAEEGDIDLKTELVIPEILVLTKLKVHNDVINKKIGIDLYGNFIEYYLRLKVSKDRESRKEFVDVNRMDRFRQNLKDFANFDNLLEVKK